MIGGIYFAGAPFAGMLRLGAQAASLAASAVISFTSTATISRGPAILQADAHIVWTAARADLRFPPVDTSAGIWIGGVNVTGRVRVQGVTIHDILNDAPNTASLTIEGDAPAVGQAVRILTGARLLFAGMVQSIDESYKVDPDVPAWHITAIDDTGIANARRPFGVWVDVSATTIAQAMTTTFAPGFSTAGIEAGLPPVRIVFDGADPFISCLTRLATAVGGYCKIEDHVVYLFTDDTADPPHPIDPDHCFLHDPPIVMTTDSSQLRTRVYGKGYGEHVPSDIAAGETLLPIENGAQFPAVGGRAIVGVTADGAQSEQIAYTSVERATGGTLVGPGAAPPNAPLVATISGAGIEAGTHDYAYGYVTATGPTTPSPIARVTIGVLQPPPTAPAANVQAGNGPNDGAHLFALSFVTATGETPPGPTVLATTSSTPIAAPGTPSNSQSTFEAGHTSWNVGDTIFVVQVYQDASGGTAPSPNSNTFVSVASTNNGLAAQGQTVIYAPPSGVTAFRVYVNRNGTWLGYKTTAPGAFPFSFFYGPGAFTAGTPPATNTATTPTRTVVLSGLPTQALATGRKVWGTAAGGAQLKFIATINTTDTTYTVTTADAALGANAPTTNTATGLNRATVTYPASGAAAVTNIQLYRSAAGATQLKLLTTVGSNTAGTYTDSTADAALGANAPAGDTSGLTQPSGQVNPGATVLPVAASAPFRSGGGWVVLGGGQVVRFTGISGQTLTGIPAAGAGAITTAVIYGSQAIPAPMLVGVTGLTKAMQKGSAVHLWIQRDDLAAQAEHAARTGGDGIVEYLIVDLRRGVDSLTARCDADLALFSRPLVTVAYSTHDLKTKSGKQVVVDLPAPLLMQATLTIQDVTISKLDIVPYLPPLFTVKASSVRFSLEDTLRRLIAGGLTVGGST